MDATDVPAIKVETRYDRIRKAKTNPPDVIALGGRIESGRPKAEAG
jgi:hypothetical protein